MGKAFRAYGWWLLGVAMSVGLAFLYHRRLQGDFDGLGLKLDIEEPDVEETT